MSTIRMTLDAWLDLAGEVADTYAGQAFPPETATRWYPSLGVHALSPQAAELVAQGRAALAELDAPERAEQIGGGS